MVVGEPMPRAFEHEDERQTLLRNQLRQPVALGGAGIANRSAEYGEVFNPRQRGAPIDEAVPCNRAIRWRSGWPAFAQISGKRPDLGESAGIKQRLCALAGVELARRAIF